MKAIWNGKTIAESNNTILVEGNHYFPKADVNQKYCVESNTHTVCPWKGTASYFHLEVDGKVNKDAAWFYENPKMAAWHIKDHIAFYKGVEVVE